MPYENLIVTRSGGVEVLAMNRPERLNAMTAGLHADLRAALAAAREDDAVKVVVLTGEGRAFSSGQDLTEDLPRGADGAPELGQVLERDYNPLVLTLADFPKVTIAALNGPAVGASMNIALACDLVVASASSYLQEGFAKIALVPDAGGTWILPRLVGPKRALALMLTAQPVPAQEALAMGLVARVLPDEGFREAVVALAGELAAGPTLAYRWMKEAVREGMAASLEEQLALEARLQARAVRTADFAEGVAAFRDKRRPRFRGA